MSDAQPYTDEELEGLCAYISLAPKHEIWTPVIKELIATILASKADVEKNAALVRGHEQAAEFKPEETAPKDGRLVELLVEGDDNHTEDEKRWRTIGHNQRDTTGEDLWELAGWNWSHDFWCEARNFRVIGWRDIRPAVTAGNVTT